MGTTELETQLAIHRSALIHNLQQALRDTLFDARPSVRPNQLEGLAQAEADVFEDFLREPNLTTAQGRGAQLCENGLAVSSILGTGYPSREIHIRGYLSR